MSGKTTSTGTSTGASSRATSRKNGTSSGQSTTTTTTTGKGGTSVSGGSKARAGTGASPLPNRFVKVCSSGQRFAGNSVATAKYTFLSFIPSFLFEQFRRYSNIFFLCTVLFQQIPNVSPTGKYTTLVPLVFILFMSAVKEIFEDVKRHRADSRMNNTQAEVLDPTNKRVTKKKWKDIVVGDLVFLMQDQFFPTDLLLVSSHEPGGLCYIETSNLDGETNLKARSALQVTDKYCAKYSRYGNKALDIEATSACPLIGSSIECDPPNKMLYEFYGKLSTKATGEQFAIGPDNILLRGAKLCNTKWALGCVLYTGHETKLMMNTSAQAPLKQSHVEMSTNRQILALLGILLVMCLVSASASVWWVNAHGHLHWYLHELKSKNFVLIFLTFVILYNNLIPISLQVTLELVRFIQAHFINSDLEMYCEETETAAMARTSNLNEELGQVRYILSDKTGTLTRNVMEFKKCAISGTIFDETKFDRLISIVRKKEKDCEKIREFLVLLAVCHTVIPEPVKNSDSGPRFTYTASSPDEAALVKGAQTIGFEFVQRTPRQVVIDAMGTTEKYEIMKVFEFDSDRKRMSVIVRTPANKLKLYIKGADSIIQSRLSNESLKVFDKTAAALTTFATDGLRTLCVASTDLTQEKYANWEKRWSKAVLMSKTPGTVNAEGKSREQCLNELMSEMESNLTLLGATAIEDKLQVGVPETIETLMKAGINIWMLTGDKQETAINIGYSCRLLKSTQTLDSYHIVNEDTVDKTREAMTVARNKIRAHPNDFTLIIDHKSLSFALKPALMSLFMDVSLQCRSVICCRVSPSQKAEIVDAVKKTAKCITLAIGDGANDVPMIRAADVGVGISGREGLQAVFSSDYAIAQFRFLARLLLVHGSWSMSRVSKLILYYLYKNIAFYVIELWFASLSAWGGQPIFERWSLSLYNVIFTAAPPMVIGLFDRVSSAETMMTSPELYRAQWSAFSAKLFWFWFGCSIWHSLVLFWLSYFALRHDALWASGKSDGGYLCFGNILYTFVVVTVCLKAALETSTWTIVTHAAIWGSIATWFLYMVVCSHLWPALSFGADMASMDSIIFSTWLFWLGLAIIPFVALLLDIVVKLIGRACFRGQADTDSKSHKPQPTHGEQRTRMLTATTKAEIDAQHGYSFSQEDSKTSGISQAKVIRMYTTQMSAQ